jgi:hypothetical protein
MARSGKRQHRLSDGYSFEGFRPEATLRGVFGDPNVRIVALERRSKKPSAVAAGGSRGVGTTGGYAGFATCRAPGCESFWSLKYGALRAAVAAP